METEKETRAEKMKAFSNTAILQRTLGSPLGQLPALSNASPSQEHSVAPSPLIAPREEGSSGRRGLAGSAIAVCFLGSQTWSSGMNLAFILGKFIFDSGWAGEEVSDRMTFVGGRGCHPLARCYLSIHLPSKTKV